MRPIIRERILKRFNNKCVQCGSEEKLHIDHIIPISRGGREDEDNMQVLCRTCNLKKGKGLDFTKYFKTGIDNEYILLDRSFIEILPNLKSGEFTAILIQMFKKNEKELSPCEDK